MLNCLAVSDLATSLGYSETQLVYSKMSSGLSAIRRQAKARSPGSATSGRSTESSSSARALGPSGRTKRWSLTLLCAVGTWGQYCFLVTKIPRPRISRPYKSNTGLDNWSSTMIQNWLGRPMSDWTHEIALDKYDFDQENCPEAPRARLFRVGVALSKPSAWKVRSARSKRCGGQLHRLHFSCFFVYQKTVNVRPAWAFGMAVSTCSRTRSGCKRLPGCCLTVEIRFAVLKLASRIPCISYCPRKHWNSTRDEKVEQQSDRGDSRE